MTLGKREPNGKPDSPSAVSRLSAKLPWKPHNHAAEYGWVRMSMDRDIDEARAVAEPRS
jgi:hypothetical protein